MSTTQSLQASSYISSRSRAERLFDQLFCDPELCSICFARKRTFYPEYDAAVAEHLLGRNGTVLESLGHRVTNDGELMVNKATSDADPACYKEVIPPKTGQYGEILEPSRPHSICQCGVIDFDLDEDHRSKKQLYDAIENIAEQIEEREADPRFSLSAAKEVVRQATKRDSLAGHDRRILVGAMELGFDIGAEE